MKKINKKIEELRIAAIATDQNACGNYRISIPLRALNKQIPNLKVLNFSQTLNFELLSQSDILIFQRVIDPKVVQIMKKLKLAGKIVILEVDDDLTSIKSHNPSYQAYKPNSPYLNNFIEAMKIADFIHVTTDFLKNVYVEKLKLNPNKIFCFNNSIDLSNPNYKINYRSKLLEDKIIFGFQGGSSHHIDLEEIISPVKAILENYPDTMFAFCNHQSLFNKFNIDSSRAIMIPPETNFEKFIPIPSYFDVGLIPLNSKDCFNWSKSYLKILEFAAFNVPCITSAVGDYVKYKEVNPSGVVLTKNKFLDWYKNIERLISSKELRQSIANSASSDLKCGETSLKKINNERYEFFKSLCLKYME